jgi:serine-type D-Ala-D-Ala carboxypeptidase/endopeptidase (penicillin-binding protein 4)
MVGLLESNELIYQKNANQLFIPASNQKIFTGAFVLDQLGPDFQYHTYLYRTGAIDTSGTLRGNLVILPQGDPSFSNVMMRSGPPDWIFRDWIDKVKLQNIVFIEGDLLVDCSNWNMGDLTPKGWASTVVDQYNMNASPLTLNRNMLQFRVKPANAGEAGIIEFVPAAEGYPIINNTVTGGEKGGIRVRWTPDGRIEVSGSATEATGKKLYGFPADNPALYAAAVFRSHLRAAGVNFSGSVRLVTQKRAVPPPTSDNVVALYRSPELSEMVKYMMKRSDNHFAEQMLVSVSAIRMGSGGYSNSKALQAQFLRKAGIDTREANLEDGSGLSRMNAVSPFHVYQMLVYMTRHQHADAFFDSMAIAGRDGTLRGRMGGANTVERVHAKTGHINNVSTLSGYVRLPSNNTVVFSLLVNNTRTYVDATQDRICELLSLLVI